MTLEEQMLHMSSAVKLTATLRRAVALVLLPAAALLVMTPAVAEDHVDRKVEIKILADADGEGVELDLSDLEVGETRWITTDSGKDVGVTREDDGYRLDIDGEETFIMSPGVGMHNRVMVHATTDHDGGGSYDSTSNVWVNSDHDVINLDSMTGDSVFISGLGDLDENQKADIIDALRSAGVDKEVHFAPAGGPHVMSFTTSDGVHADGDATVDVQVIRKHIDGTTDSDGNHVIFIEKKSIGEDDPDDED
jgi:hypothetical protein